MITMEPPFGSSCAGSIRQVAAYLTPSKLLLIVAGIKLSPLAIRPPPPLSFPREPCGFRVISATSTAMSYWRSVRIRRLQYSWWRPTTSWPST